MKSYIPEKNHWVQYRHPHTFGFMKTANALLVWIEHEWTKLWNSVERDFTPDRKAKDFCMLGTTWFQKIICCVSLCQVFATFNKFSFRKCFRKMLLGTEFQNTEEQYKDNTKRSLGLGYVQNIQVYRCSLVKSSV